MKLDTIVSDRHTLNSKRECIKAKDDAPEPLKKTLPSKIEPARKMFQKKETGNSIFQFPKLQSNLNYAR